LKNGLIILLIIGLKVTFSLLVGLVDVEIVREPVTNNHLEGFTCGVKQGGTLSPYLFNLF
jgi:hypothetical protein